LYQTVVNTVTLRVLSVCPIDRLLQLENNRIEMLNFDHLFTSIINTLAVHVLFFREISHNRCKYMAVNVNLQLGPTIFTRESSYAFSAS